MAEAAQLPSRDRTRIYALLRSGDLVAAPADDDQRGGGARGGPLDLRNTWALIGLASGAAARQVKWLESLATLVALVMATVGVLILGVQVERVGDIASIPRSLPAPVLPDLSVAPRLIVGAIAVSLVALASVLTMAEYET